MIEGTYKTIIKSAFIKSGICVNLLLESGRVIGGDDHCFYEGNYDYHDLTLTLKISIYQRRNDPFYPLSSLPKFTVNLKGTRSFNCFELNGNVVEEPEKMISVTLSKQHD